MMMESKEYKDLKKELDDLKSEVQKQSETLTKIHQAIVGDREFGQDGLVQMVRKHERWIESQKYLWAKIWGGIAVGSSIIGFALNYLVK